MKKILLVEPLAPAGHKDVNYFYLEFLRKHFYVTYVTKRSFIDITEGESLRFIRLDDSLFKDRNPLLNRIFYLYILAKVMMVSKGEKYDIIYFLSYEIFSFALFSAILLPIAKVISSKVFVLNHGNVDEVERSAIKNFFFMIIPKEFTHVCYEEFITNKLINDYKRRSVTIRHNLNNYKKNEPNYKKILVEMRGLIEKESGDLISAISNNPISDKILEKLIALDNENAFFDLNIKILVKSRKRTYIGRKLIIINKFLNDTEYNYIMQNSSFILLPYEPDKYKFRVSGVFFDAITFLKPLIYLNTYFFDYINTTYGSIGYKYDTIEELLQILKYRKKQEIDNFNENLKNIKTLYEDEIIHQELLNLLLGEKNENIIC